MALTRVVLDTARRQGWVVTRDQLLRAGANSAQITGLVRANVLVRRHPGVYIVAGAPDDHRVHARAALVSMGSSAVASHRTAGWLQGLLDRPPVLVDVTVIGTGHRRLDGVRIHRTEQLSAVLHYQGIRCTPPARTLVDLAATLSPGPLATAVDRGLANGTVRLRDVERELRSPGRRGVGHLRQCLAERGYIGAPTPSVLESAMCRLLRRYGLPVPKAEVVAGPDGRYRIDFAYPRQRVAVECYGYERHHSPEDMAYDLERQRKLTLDGWTVLIFTWRDVTRAPDQVAAQLREALRAAVSPRS